MAKDTSPAANLPRPRLAHEPVGAASADGHPDAQTAAASRSRSDFAKSRIALVLACALFGLLAGFAYGNRHNTDAMAELSRSIIGDENTARLESWYFAVHDRADRLKFRIFGGDTTPFAAYDPTYAVIDGEEWDPPSEVPIHLPVAAPPPPAKPVPLLLPETRALRPSLAAGEGVWTTAGLPRSTPDDVLMAKTFIRPDTARPYSTVGVLLVDKRRIRLHMTGGTDDPGGDRGVRGPGIIADVHRPHLLAAWNGGFRGPHGGYGMVADGKQYRPLRNGFASVAVTNTGAIKMGEWGRDLTWTEDLIAVRQNAVLLVDNCEVSRRTNEGNNTWGYVEVNSAEFITWRSAIGLTRNGDLLVAAGNSLSAATLAKALWAAGACYAMQLDINSPYVLTSVFMPQADGSLRPAKFMDSMQDNPARFYNRQQRDFMFLTLDETHFVP